MTTLNQGLLAGEVKSNLGQVLLADDLKSSLNQILQAEDLESSFTITWTCGTCPASMFAVNCFSYNGGPFYNLMASIDSSYSSCSATGFNFPIYINFNCGVACTGCGITITMSSIAQSTCADSSDGSDFIKSMDLLYGASQGDLSKTYDWCGQAGCPIGSNVGLIIGIVAGVAVVIIVIAVCINQQRRKRAAQVQYMNGDQYQTLQK